MFLKKIRMSLSLGLSDVCPCLVPGNLFLSEMPQSWCFLLFFLIYFFFFLISELYCIALKEHLDSYTMFFLIQFFFFFYITILYWFCHTLIWISHRCTRVPHPEPPSHLPPHPIPLGRPSAPAPSTLSHALNLDWQFVSYILYRFQCHSPKSSHPLPLPQSP